MAGRIHPGTGAGREKIIYNPVSVQRSSAIVAGQPSINTGIAIENFSQITKSTLPRQNVSRYAQPFDWMNIQAVYENQAAHMDVDTEYFAAEMLNERGALFIAQVAPVVIMVDRHVRINRRGAYMLPFDLMAMGGVPRKTGWWQTSSVQSLQYYERYQGLELHYLMDPNHGNDAKNEVLGILVAQGRLTLYLQASVAIMAKAVEQSFNRFRDETGTARLIHNETAFFALCNKRPDDFALAIGSLRDAYHKYNRIVFPEGAGPHIHQIAKESTSAQGYHFGYDEDTQRLVQAVFIANERAPAIMGADGKPTIFIENPSYRYSTKNGYSEEEATQTLRGLATIAEITFQPDIPADTNYDETFTGRYDPVVHDQTERRIEHKALDYGMALAGCMIWNDRDGHLRVEDPDQAWFDADVKKVFGDAFLEVIEDYNKAPEGPRIKTFLEDATYNNDSPKPESWDHGKSLRDQEFRRWMPFVSIEQGKFVAPRCILSLPERALPQAFFDKAVRKLASDYRNSRFSEKTEKTEIDDFMTSMLPDKGYWDKPEISEKETLDVVDKGDALAPGEGGDTKSLLTVPWAAVLTHFAKPGDVVAHVASQKLRLGSPMEKALLHVPDSHLSHYLRTAQAVATELARPELAAEQRAAVEAGWQTFYTALVESSGKTSARNVLENAANHVDSGRSMADVPANKFLTVRAKTAERALESSQTTMSTSLRAAGTSGKRARSDDAMDIDADPAPPGFSFSSSFGSLALKRVGRDVTKTTSILETRLRDLRQLGKEDSTDELTIARFLATAFFSYRNVYTLFKKTGIQLFRINYWRPWQRYRMLNLVAMVGGPQTMITGLCAPMVWPTMHGMEGYVNIIASFLSAAIVGVPENFRLLANAIADRLLADINTQFVRSQEEIRATSPHKPSTWAVPVPLDERTYETPMHMLNEDIIHPNDLNARSPMAKHSGADLMFAFAGKEYFRRAISEMKTGDPYHSNLMSLIGHRSHALHLVDPVSRRHVSVPGTGPRALANTVACQAAEVFAGRAMRFPDMPLFTVVT